MVEINKLGDRNMVQEDKFEDKNMAEDNRVEDSTEDMLDCSPCSLVCLSSQDEPSIDKGII